MSRRNIKSTFSDESLDVFDGHASDADFDELLNIGNTPITKPPVAPMSPHSRAIAWAKVRSLSDAAAHLPALHINAFQRNQSVPQTPEGNFFY
jgi:hypothetical protein